jgi:hypothetical protein
MSAGRALEGLLCVSKVVALVDPHLIATVVYTTGALSELSGRDPDCEEPAAVAAVAAIVRRAHVGHTHPCASALPPNVPVDVPSHSRA